MINDSPERSAPIATVELTAARVAVRTAVLGRAEETGVSIDNPASAQGFWWAPGHAVPACPGRGVAVRR